MLDEMRAKLMGSRQENNPQNQEKVITEAINTSIIEPK